MSFQKMTVFEEIYGTEDIPSGTTLRNPSKINLLNDFFVLPLMILRSDMFMLTICSCCHNSLF